MCGFLSTLSKKSFIKYLEKNNVFEYLGQFDEILKEDDTVINILCKYMATISATGISKLMESPDIEEKIFLLKSQILNHPLVAEKILELGITADSSNEEIISAFVAFKINWLKENLFSKINLSKPLTPCKIISTIFDYIFDIHIDPVLTHLGINIGKDVELSMTTIDTCLQVFVDVMESDDPDGHIKEIDIGDFSIKIIDKKKKKKYQNKKDKINKKKANFDNIKKMLHFKGVNDNFKNILQDEGVHDNNLMKEFLNELNNTPGKSNDEMKKFIDKMEKSNAEIEKSNDEIEKEQDNSNFLNQILTGIPLKNPQKLMMI